MTRHLGRRLVALFVVLACCIALDRSPAAAHPLGNFSVNHLNRLTFTADRVIDDAIIDTAEIPTAQAESQVDQDGDGVASEAELAAYGAAGCDAFGQSVSLRVDGEPKAFSVTDASFGYFPGQAGLPTSRLECRLEAAVDLTAARSVEFDDRYLTDRVGWHEINAIGDGARIVESPVPQESITDGLRSYPVDLLSSPLDVRSATFDIQPGEGPSTESADARKGLGDTEPGFFSGTLDRVQREFNDLIGRRELTLGVGLLAIGLALILGASHALLPGHGKTVMAAYIAGRQGSVRDAVIVGATVTGTHTGGVLLLGLALTLSTSLAGESVLGWLGVTSGVLVAGLGIGLLIGAIRHRGNTAFGHGHTHAYSFGHDHSPGHSDDHSHGLGHVHSHGLGHGHSHDHSDDHSHGHEHDQPHGLGHDHSHCHEHGHSHEPGDSNGHDHHERDHHQHDDHQHDVLAGAISRSALARGVVVGRGDLSASTEAFDPHALLTPTTPSTTTSGPLSGGPGSARSPESLDVHQPPRPVSRVGLVGMGIAGGLVPSPSALVILLSAIALGRTWFGILLVVGYGLGMAGTLTAAGVLLVKVRDRYQHRMQSSSGRIRGAARRWGTVAPYVTAVLVLIVGIGLAIRSLGSV